MFDALQRAVTEDGTLRSELSVSTIMKSWTNQKGFPILSVTRNYKAGSLKLSQWRYRTYTLEIDYNTTYWIPYNFITNNDRITNNTLPDDWLPQHVNWQSINQTANRTWSPSDWIIFNNQNTGYYRIKYDDQNYRLIANALADDNLEKIPMLNRAQLIDDAFSFAKANLVDIQLPLNLTKYLRRELEYVPWASAIKGLTLVNRMFAGNESYVKF